MPLADRKVQGPPILLTTNHVVALSRLSWLSHDGMIGGGDHGLRRPATSRTSPCACPAWLSAVRYDRATGPMDMDWLGFGCSQIMITRGGNTLMPTSLPVIRYSRMAFRPP